MSAAAPTKDLILDAAEELFAEHGYAATSLRRLTERAGVNLAAVHYHFGGKEALAKAVLARRIAPINAERLRRLAALPTGRAGVEAIARCRPILLTSLTTFGGLTSLLLERSVQARFLVPMAISLGFGVMFATLISLVLVPTLYLVLDDVRRATARTLRWGRDLYSRSPAGA